MTLLLGPGVDEGERGETLSRSSLLPEVCEWK